VNLGKSVRLESLTCVCRQTTFTRFAWHAITRTIDHWAARYGSLRAAVDQRSGLL